MAVRTLVIAAAAVVGAGVLAVGPYSGEAEAQSRAAALARGEAVYRKWCAPCHAPGPGHPGTQSLELRYRDTPLSPVLEEREDLTPELVKTFVRQGVLMMAPFRKTEITDAELDDLAAYLTE
ncbi:MAG: cytochrome c [Gammaproteobacteria bacterium]|nr:cytochrome c [Gammaproteobacteria bacterium]